MNAPRMQRSVPDVLEDIATNLAQLVQAEFRLAKTELKEGAQKAAVYAMSLVMAGWLAALIVGGVLAVAAGILVGAGIAKLRRANLIPEKTIRTLEEDAQWAKQQIK